MNYQIKRHASKRVADYFTVIGPGEKLQCSRDQSFSKFSGLKFKSNSLERYPLSDWDNNALPEGLSLFCFPNGIEISDSLQVPTFHSFVLTSEEGSRMLGSCLTFFEPLTSQQLSSLKMELLEHNIVEATKVDDLINSRTFFCPRCLCLISNWTFVSSFKRLLCGLYELSLSPCNIPIERYICNIIDDIPAPPAGRVDVTYYLGEQPISFRCPPINQPNVWSGLPLFPLFECLSPENVLQLFALVLTERQILFVSSQYSLLTSCAEAITSLIYPFSWTHAYIPILPTKLLGVLGAPFPFILGIHASLLGRPECAVGEDTVTVYLDTNTLDFGILGPAPPLPERRGKKLFNQISTEASRIFEGRGEDWSHVRLTHFDDAFSSVSEKPGCVYGLSSFNKKSVIVDESALRTAFVGFFVAIFMNYRRHLIFGTSQDPDPLVKFNFAAFLAEHPSDWQPFLRLMIDTQTFSQFIDLRTLETSHDPDVMFFDESISAKMNRYTLRWQNFDTPFLRDDMDKHAKTYVPPSPDSTSLILEDAPFIYSRFPSLNPDLFSTPRRLPSPLDSQSIVSISMARLKRANPVAGGTPPPVLSAAACAYSCHLVVLARVVSFAQMQSSSMHRPAVRPSIMQIIEEYATPEGTADSEDPSPIGPELVSSDSVAVPSPTSASSASSNRRNSMSRDKAGTSLRDRTFSCRRRSDSTDHYESRALVASAKLGLKVALECLSCLSQLDECADDPIYRNLVDACGNCGFGKEVVDLIVHMSDEGLLPDNAMLASVAKALATDVSRETMDEFAVKVGTGMASTSSQLPNPSDVWTMTDAQWRLAQRGNGLIYRRKMYGGSGFPQSPSTTRSPMSGNGNGAAISRESDPGGLVSWLWGLNTPAAASQAGGLTAAAESLFSTPTRPTRDSTTGARNSYRCQFPDLEWKNFVSENRKPIFQASSKLKRQMAHSENLLLQNFPGLVINIDDPIGMCCPGPPGKVCPVNRAQTLPEIYSGWDVGNPNKYTCRCFACDREFVPRFTVECDAAEWTGSEGLGTPLWCELLSPWTLRKEFFNIIVVEGIECILSPKFRDSSVSPQHAVLFWNAIILFRLYGLPFSYLLCTKSIQEAFPPKAKDAR